MDIPSILLSVVIFLAATSICLFFFERLGFGSILGFIVAGIIIGPHTPGPTPTQAVDELQSIAELGVVLFLFTVGLEMQPQKLWSMRRQIFGLGSAQMVGTTAILAVYLIAFFGTSWESATILGLGLAMSSTAIVMATLGERGELAKPHGRTGFAILMAQDLWIIPVMALVPILAHQTSAATTPLWQTIGLVLVVLGGILLVGRYLLPPLLGACARRRQMDVFSVVLFLAVTAAAWAVDRAGISMTLGAFLLGMLLSASDFRYQVEATVAPYKDSLMGLFFIAVGMSIDVGALAREWSTLIVHVPVVLVVKGAVLFILAFAFGLSRAASIRTGFYLSQVGEFAFVLFGAAAVAGLLNPRGHTLATLVIALSMVATPLMVIASNQLARGQEKPTSAEDEEPRADLERHVVIVGYEEQGQLIDLMLERADIPRIAFDLDINIVRQGRQVGRNVHYGDMFRSATQQAASLGKASAAYVSMRNKRRSKALALTLHQLYPDLELYVEVSNFTEIQDMSRHGISKVGADYVESTLAGGRMLLMDMGVTEADANGVVNDLKQNAYAAIRSAHFQR